MVRESAFTDYERKKRQLEVKMASRVNQLGAVPLSEEDMKTVELYVNGEIDYKELVKITKEKYIQ